MDYYSLLGVGRDASQDEIKKAYRKASMKHHPDRGGDEVQFKKINEAYDTLSNPQKKEIYDMGGDPNQQGGAGGFHHGGPFEWHFGGGDPRDFFGGFGFGRQPPRNKSVNITITVTLEDILFGKTIHAEVAMPGNKTKLVTIDIPKGIEHGQHIRYQGMGDDSIRNVPPGDLIVNINIQPHHEYMRHGENLVCEKLVSVWDCLLGTSLSIATIDGKTLSINIPAGTQPGTTLSCKGEGLPNIHSGRRGNILIKIKTTIPKNLPETIKNKIKQIKDSL